MLPRSYYYLKNVNDRLQNQEDLRDFQERTLIQVVSTAGDKDFYAEKWNDAGFKPESFSSLEDLERIPPLEQEEKTEIPGIDDRTGEIPENEYLLSSGSTGAQTQVEYDSQAYDWLSAVHMKRLFERGYSITMDQFRYRAKPIERGILENFFFPQERINPENSLEGQVAALEEMEGGFLFYFSNVLFTLAKKIESRRKSFEGDIDGIVCHGEILTDNMRNTISDVFGAPVHAHYGTAELHTLGWSCPDSGGYHVENESVVIEVLDQEGNPVSDGETGEVVATSLVKTLSPLIRYRTGDMAERMEDGCGCSAGSKRIDLKGRKSETFQNDEGEKIFPRQVVELLSQFHDLLLYQLVVENSGAVLKYVPNKDFNKSSIEKARHTVESSLGLDVRTRKVENISRTPGGKIPPVRIQDC